MPRALTCLAIAAATAAALGALAGCAPGDGAANASTSDTGQQTITVDSVPVADEAGLYVAQDEGYFAQQGLTVKIRSITGGEAAIPDLQSGRAQLVAGNYVSFILAQMAGKFDGKPISMRIIAPGSEMTPGTEALYVMPHSRYQTVAELARAHARIGLNTGNDIGDLLVGATLAENGYALSDIRQVIPAGGFPDVLKFLGTGKIDAAWLPQPLGEQAEQQMGAEPVADFDQGSLENFPFTGYIGATGWVRSHPGTVAAFLRALTKGQQLADTDRAAAQTAAVKYMGVSPMIAATMDFETYPLTLDVPQLQRLADSMSQFGLTPRSQGAFQIKSMIQPEPGLIGG